MVVVMCGGMFMVVVGGRRFIKLVGICGWNNVWLG